MFAYPASLLICRTSPVKTLPGPTSINFSTPLAAMFSTDCSQRTGEETAAI